MSAQGPARPRGVAKRRRSWERRSEARPAELVAAAAKLFGERGFGATRMEDVAARAGVTKATVYLYFQDKEQLFKAVVQEALAPNLERAEALLSTFDGSTPTLLRMLLALFEGVLATDYTAIAKMIITEAATFPELAKLYEGLVVRRGFALIERIVQRGIDRGEFRPVQPTAVVPLVLAPFVLLMLWKHSLGLHSELMRPPREVLEEHLTLLLRGLAVEGGQGGG